MRDFPRRLGEWVGTDRELSDRQYELLETREVLFREFRKGGAGPEVLACVAVAGANRKVAHPPEICYRGQGWRIVDQSEVELTIAGVKRRVQELHIEKNGREHLVQSWYRVGERETPSYLLQQWLGLVADLTRSVEPSALLRFSAPIEDGDARAARAALTEFLAIALPELEQELGGPPEAADGNEP
jgi:EpsI family protein